MISFNVPPHVGGEEEYISEAIRAHKISGDGVFSEKCSRWLEQNVKVQHALLTTSCSHALEMAALLLDIRPGDEVILPSFTFVSTANAFVLRGGVPVFVDIRPDTMNIDENLIEDAITPRTRAIVPVHYAGVGAEMDVICEIAARHGVAVVEDAAQGICAYYKGRALGSFGDCGCISFHETKNLSCGEGGALLLRDDKYFFDAEIIREKGTDRSRFFRGEIDKYSWRNMGSSYLPSELNAAYLFAQMEKAKDIMADRLESWGYYYKGLYGIAEKGLIELPFVPDHCEHNGHLFYIKVRDIAQRNELISYLNECGVNAVFHYIPLHSAPAGRRFGRFFGEDRYTTTESERLVRLPMYYGLTRADQERVISAVESFFDGSK